MTILLLIHAEVASLKRTAALLIVGIMSAFMVQNCQADNVALNKPATANAVYSSYGPGRAVDGDVLTAWSGTTQGSPESPQWLKVDLEVVIPIYRITLVGPSSGTYAGYTIIYELYGSADNTNWTQLGAGSLVDTTDYVDMIYPSGRGFRYIWYNVVGGSHWAQLEELEVYPSIMFTDIAVVDGSVQLALTNCLIDTTNVVERTFDLSDSNAWTTVTNLTDIETSYQWSEAISNSWPRVFYRATTLQGVRP